jgi:hypothetical protein
MGLGFNSGGSVVTPVFIEGKKGYQCNNGKQYWE